MKKFKIQKRKYKYLVWFGEQINKQFDAATLVDNESISWNLSKFSQRSHNIDKHFIRLII